MIPANFTSFFLGSLAAGGALVGLLFVAISIAPERTVRRAAPPERHATAASAFGALADPFFISLVALIPGWNVGWGALGFAALGLANTYSQAHLLFSQHVVPDRTSRARRLAIIAPGAIVYVAQLGIAWWLLALPRSDVAVHLLALSLVAMDLVGITRSWELIVAESTGLLSRLDHAHESALFNARAVAAATDEPPIQTPSGA